MNIAYLNQPCKNIKQENIKEVANSECVIIEILNNETNILVYFR